MSKYHEDLDMLHSSNVHLYRFTEFTFDMDPLCIVCGHDFLLLSMGIPASGRYCIFRSLHCLTCRCFSTPALKILLLYPPILVIKEYQYQEYQNKININIFRPLAYIRSSHLRGFLLTTKLTPLRVLVWKHISISPATWRLEFLNNWELQSLIWPLLPQRNKCLKTMWL